MKMKPKILLINPPIYDFTAYDFWLKPYGLLSVAGFGRGKADFTLFDYLDRLHPSLANDTELKGDRWQRGRFPFQRIPNPPALAEIPRYFRRFGLVRNIFQDFLKQRGPFDYVIIETVMTYWYGGVREVIEDVRKFQPDAKIILGGNYVTLCPDHAKSLQADLLIRGIDLGALWKYLDIKPDSSQPALWEAYDKLSVGVLKLTQGCPFKCTYCSVPAVYGKFKVRPLERSLSELKLLCEKSAKDIAFYDDALLFKPEAALIPFLSKVIKQDIKVNFHTPNALNARFITAELAELMVRAGFKTFYLGFESVSEKFQRKTGSKVHSGELASAVEHLLAAGAEVREITAYQILGHPNTDIQRLKESMGFVNSLGIRGMLADFSPIPSTPDGEICRKWVDMAEPLMHNKTAFPIILLGNETVNRLKDLQRKFNWEISGKN